MTAFDPYDVEKLLPAALCSYIRTEFYTEIKELLPGIHKNILGLIEKSNNEGQRRLQQLLFLKLEDETNQMIRNDELVIFPLIEKRLAPHKPVQIKWPVQTMQKLVFNIITLLEKTRQVFNNYVPGPNWINGELETCNNLFRLEQLLQEVIFIKENYLLHKVKEDLVPKNN